MDSHLYLNVHTVDFDCVIIINKSVICAAGNYRDYKTAVTYCLTIWQLGSKLNGMYLLLRKQINKNDTMTQKKIVCLC